MAVCERGVERCGRRPSAGAVATEAAIGSRRGRASRASSGIRRYFMLLPRTTSSGSFQKRSPSREVQITSRRQMFIQLSQLTRWPLYVSPFLSSTSIGCPCDVRRSESGSTIPPRPVARVRASGYKRRNSSRQLGAQRWNWHHSLRGTAAWSHHHFHHHFHRRRCRWTTGWSHCA